jgi:hypothetical protein
LITCRPFDKSLDLYNKKNLDSVNDLKGMANFSDVAKSAWTTDDGKTTFCVPMASVIHGFIYNKDAFKKIGAEPSRRPWRSSTRCSTSSRRTEPTRRSCSAPPTSGRRRRWASRTSGRTTGAARPAVWR